MRLLTLGEVTLEIRRAYAELAPERWGMHAAELSIEEHGADVSGYRVTVNVRVSFASQNPRLMGTRTPREKGRAGRHRERARRNRTTVRCSIQ